MGVLRRKSPLFQRKSSRNVSAIEAEVEDVVQRSPFLGAVAEHQQQQQQQQQSALPKEVERVSSDSRMPAAFSRKELQLGQLLGTGSFSAVHSVSGYNLTADKKCNSRNSRPGSCNSKKCKQKKRSFSSSSFSDDSCSCSIGSPSSASFFLGSFRQHQQQCANRRVVLLKSTFEATETSRYAVKMVKKELKNKPHFRRAAVDLIVEAKYLAALDHPNIINLRGIAIGESSGFVDGYDGFFIILDRLHETLEGRIDSWKQYPRGSLQHQHDLLILQAEYALQLGNALVYLHDRRIMFRDLKPSNVGFLSEDPYRVQLFDFGLCRELPRESNSNSNDNDSMLFRMSWAGTYLYMASEVVNQQTYNLKCDVYSWAFLFHEMIALARPFGNYSKSEHKEFVCEIGQRPSVVHYNLPLSLQELLRQAWAHDPKMRSSMRQACQQLEPILRGLRCQ